MFTSEFNQHEINISEEILEEMYLPWFRENAMYTWRD